MKRSARKTRLMVRCLFYLCGKKKHSLHNPRQRMGRASPLGEFKTLYLRGYTEGGEKSAVHKWVKPWSEWIIGNIKVSAAADVQSSPVDCLHASEQQLRSTLRCAVKKWGSAVMNQQDSDSVNISVALFNCVLLES